jgi:hypothetical protein
MFRIYSNRDERKVIKNEAGMMGEGMTYNKAYMYIEEYREAMKYFNCDE